MAGLFMFLEGFTTYTVAWTLAVVVYYLAVQSELSLRVKQKELEIAENKVAIMLSQIRPHFLYNSLTAIKELCYIDPETAGKLVNDFSNYLRVNIDSLSIKTPVPFENELRHTQTYLSLEKKRFGEKLKVNYDISVINFSLPTLTLQPLMENAVRHGVMKREEGGTITVKTEEKPEHIEITITDDGVGFSREHSLNNNGHISVGINNVKARLENFSNGTLTIISEPGVGTTAIVTIPKEMQ
jgi:sensor histidine kinase YesM